MRRNDELRIAIFNHIVYQCEKCKLLLRGKCAFGLVHEKYPRIHPCPHHVEKRFAVRPLVEGSTAIARIRVADKVPVITATVQQRRKTLLEFRAKEESMPRTLRPPRSQIRREFAFSAMIRKFALPSTPHGKPCDVNQRFKKRRFPRPVFAHQKRDRCRDAQVEILHKWKRKRELVPFSILRYLASDICQIYLYVSHWLLDLVLATFSHWQHFPLSSRARDETSIPLRRAAEDKLIRANGFMGCSFRWFA